MSAPIFASLAASDRLLLGPGPSNVAPSVLEVMSQKPLGHLDPEFLRIVDEVQMMLRYLFGTENKVTFPVSATGSAGMETCFSCLIEPGDRVLVGKNGVFGGRMAEVAARCGAEVIPLEKPWGQVFSLDELDAAMTKHRPKVVGLVHGETSTGALQPLAEIGPLVRSHNAYLIADCVTTLAGSVVEVDAWQVDAAYSGTQKCLSCPPGLAPVTFNERALEKVRARKTKVQSWYFDVTLIEGYFGTERSYHHTAPINMIYALHESLRLVCKEGKENAVERHQSVHHYIRQALESRGLYYVADLNNLLPQLNAVQAPKDEAAIRSKLLTECGIEIGGGLGAFKGKAWRIGLMGANAHKKVADQLLLALDRYLKPA